MYVLRKDNWKAIRWIPIFVAATICIKLYHILISVASADQQLLVAEAVEIARLQSNNINNKTRKGQSRNIGPHTGHMTSAWTASLLAE
jgi:hypothetical protein